MKLLGKTRYVIGVNVEPNLALVADDEVLKAIFLGFMHVACANLSADTPDGEIGVTIWRESLSHGAYNIGFARVHNLSNKDLDQAVERYERKLQEFSVGRRRVELCFAIGTPVFCQTFLHFMAASDEGLVPSWSLHYMRKLTTARRGDAIWYDTGTPQDFFADRMENLIATFRQDFQK